MQSSLAPWWERKSTAAALVCSRRCRWSGPPSHLWWTSRDIWPATGSSWTSRPRPTSIFITAMRGSWSAISASTCSSIPLSKLFGLELALKLIVLCIPPLLVAGFLWTAREVHGRIPPTAFFALPFAYNFPFMFGFINFTLGMGLAFVAFALWLRLGRQERWRTRAVLFVPVALLLWLCHAMAWAVLGAMAFAEALVRARQAGRPLLEAGYRAGLDCLPTGAARAFDDRLAQRPGSRRDRGLVQPAVEAEGPDLGPCAIAGGGSTGRPMRSSCSSSAGRCATAGSAMPQRWARRPSS